MTRWAEDAMREAVDLFARYGRNDLASDLNRILTVVDFGSLDVLRSAESDRLADEILQAETFAELVALLGRLSEALGVTHVTLHVISESPSTSFSTKVLTTYPDTWISRYVERRYSPVDPVGRACLANGHGFFWAALDHASPLLQAFWADAAAHGVGPSGFTMPIETQRGDRLALSLCSAEEDEPFRERIDRFECDLRSLGIFLSDTFCRLASEDRPPDFNPTDDQLAVLRAIAMGADEAELSGRGYRNTSWKALERSICELFRTRTLAQAAVLAARIGLLAEAPLTKADILTGSAVPSRFAPAPARPSLLRLARLRGPAADPSDAT
jgi:hypothetical protein